MPDGQLNGNICSNWPILGGIGQKNKFMARNIYLANFKQFQTIVAKEIFIWLIGRFAANFSSNFIFCHVYFT
jgi:hypothetical protein